MLASVRKIFEFRVFDTSSHECSFESLIDISAKSKLNVVNKKHILLLLELDMLLKQHSQSKSASPRFNTLKDLNEIPNRNSLKMLFLLPFSYLY